VQEHRSDPRAIERIEGWLRELAAVIDRINCGLVGRDAEGRIIFVNERLIQWLSYAREELLGRPVEVLFPPELSEVTRSEVRATEAGDMRARLSALQRKDSTTLPVVIIPQAFEDEDGKFAGIVSVVVDLGTIQTAKRVGAAPVEGLGARLDQIAEELHSLSLSATLTAPASVPLSHPDLAELSRREVEVLGHLVAGERVASIAAELHISPHTVRNHLKSMFRKLDVSTQTELIECVRSLSQPAAESEAVED
jgi:PAS domain S-box-containing protein